ncbi:LpxI family protein [Pseudooceanicola algae]|uniref:UDP-2,3-diacylglucosamine pyrophosphatase LpxI n=1 Tax=Pseudooceanicola algae TaxID=1537215 RepID=A0A418SDT2_9RHOB|nr:UDP-2,3-diacylglucosamine diphosphatase LpxI [Pseudooceanicola algae]QPM89511.1 UDP-2,3-diacylglucosamine pyrophosphatase LpxI [Pseudooceanicola algae]
MTQNSPRAKADPGSGTGLAIIAGAGALPLQIAAAHPEALLISFHDLDCDLPEGSLQRHRYEQLGGLFDALRAAGVTRVVMAGAMSRPDFDPSLMDETVQGLMPRLVAAMGAGGDDSLLRLIISLFEERGFSVVGAHDLLPGLTASAGLFAGPGLSDQATVDARRGQEILVTMAPLDIGQGCVVAGGLCLGLETVQGTDALLRFVAQTPRHLRRGKGVLCKFPKQGQDLRVDMPAIGPATLRAAAAAGLDGIVIAAGQVLLLEAAKLADLADDLGLTIQAEPF